MPLILSYTGGKVLDFKFFDGNSLLVKENGTMELFFKLVGISADKDPFPRSALLQSPLDLGFIVTIEKEKA